MQQAFGTELSKQEIEALYRKADSDNSNDVTEEELAACLTAAHADGEISKVGRTCIGQHPLRRCHTFTVVVGGAPIAAHTDDCKGGFRNRPPVLALFVTACSGSATCAATQPRMSARRSRIVAQGKAACDAVGMHACFAGHAAQAPPDLCTVAAGAWRMSTGCPPAHGNDPRVLRSWSGGAR